ncbi:MAG TPA: hypothetical protein QF873_00280 [Patescibacteria group bacterium]|nr:hypothetical protein [Patescibacteria group bacterium]
MAQFISSLFQTLLALAFGPKNYSVETFARSKRYIVMPTYLGHCLDEFATKSDTVELGYNPDTQDFAFIVSDLNVDPATVEAQLPEGYLLVAEIKPDGMSFADVTGEITDLVNDKKFMAGIETVLATSFATDGVNFRHARIDAGKLVTLKIVFNVGYSDLETDKLGSFVQMMKTADERVIVFTQVIHGETYLVTADGMYVDTEKPSALNAAGILKAGGKVICSVVENIEFPIDGAPVTKVLTDNGMLLGFDDGTNIAIAIAKDGTVTSESDTTEYGAMLALDMVTGDKPTAIFDNGDVMTRMPLEVLDPTLINAIGRWIPTSTPTARTAPTVN